MEILSHSNEFLPLGIETWWYKAKVQKTTLNAQGYAIAVPVGELSSTGFRPCRTTVAQVVR